MTAFTVPVVDLASSSPAAFTAALRESSCLFITGHGVPGELMAEMTGKPSQRSPTSEWM